MSTHYYIIFVLCRNYDTMVYEDNQLSIEPGDNGIIISKGVDEQIITTDENLLTALVNRNDSADFFVSFQKKQLIKEQEQYEAMKPAGFVYAPESFHKKREEYYASTGNLEKF